MYSKTSPTFEIDVMAYQFPWSKNCRSSSIGGCAPKISTAGIFMSSTNMTHFLPIGGPYTPLRLLSSLDMTMFYSREGRVQVKLQFRTPSSCPPPKYTQSDTKNSYEYSNIYSYIIIFCKYIMLIHFRQNKVMVCCGIRWL